MNPCHLCGHVGPDVEWCPTCRVFLCRSCRGDWLARAKGALKKWLRNIVT